MTKRNHKRAKDQRSVRRTTESDVEHKLLWALLTGPDFLGIPPEAIATKRFIPRRDIGKGTAFVNGFAPDYLIYAARQPVFVIEAKAPNEPAELAYAEARMYAAEINSSYETGVNPIKFALGTNGRRILFGPTDAQPSVEWVLGDGLVPCTESSLIAERVGWSALQQAGQEIGARLERQRYFTPSYLFGGKRRLDARLGQNSLSDTLAPIIRRYFDAETPEAKAEILEKAYVDSDITTRYARTFENFLRDRTIPVHAPSVKALTPQRKSEKHFTSALSAYSNDLPSTGSIQLLVGAVGSGKSTFIERFEKFLLPEAVRSKIFWTYINFNDAPPNPDRYESWLCEQFVEQFKQRYFQGDPQIQLAIFADRKRDFDFNNFLIKESDPHEYNRRLSIELSDWARDARIFATSACRYLIGDCRVGVVCVLDNTDRRTKEQQLQLFEVAEWFKSETRSCCVIALRDETYERFKSEPPLDAFIHSNHFYIRPPRFIDIVRRRLQLTIAALHEQPISASVAGLGRVVVRQGGVEDFLDAVFRHLFASSKRKVSWITEGLSGKSARSALTMFARLIYSPHIDERNIVQAGGGFSERAIPERAILNALMKTDYLFFSEEHGFVSNIFDFTDGSSTGDNLIRIEILSFLVDRRKFIGDVNVEGYYQAATICERLSHMGYDRRDVLLELDWALKRGLLVGDHFGNRAVVESDVLKAHASAFVHTSLLLGRLEYIVNTALVTKLFSREFADRVAEIWNITAHDVDITFERKRELGAKFKQYLESRLEERDRLFPLGKELSAAGKVLAEGFEKALNYEPRQPGQTT